jgi:hypothetical protein
MGVDSISLPAPSDYGTNKFDKLTGNLSYIKKLLGAVKQWGRGAEYVIKQFKLERYPIFARILPQISGVVKFSSTGNAILEFYNSYKNIISWINPYEENSLDKQKIIDSINGSFFEVLDLRMAKEKMKPENTELIHNGGKEINEKIAKLQDLYAKDLKEKNKVLNKIIDKVVKETFATHKRYFREDDFKAHFNNSLKAKLTKKGFEGEDVAIILGNIEIAKKERATSTKVSLFFFTIADLGSNLLFLNKVALNPLGKIVSQIGKVRVLSFVANFAITTTLETVFGAAACVALTVLFVDSAHKCAKAQAEINRAKREINLATGEDERSKELRAAADTRRAAALVKRTQAIWDMVTSGTDCLCAAVSTAIPVMSTIGFVINPGVGLGVSIGLAVIAKSIGLISVFARPS